MTDEVKCVAYERWTCKDGSANTRPSDPCTFCIHICDDSDPSVGMYGYGCACEDEAGGLPMGESGPCPMFRARLPSDDLLDQLAYEQECAQWEEDEREMRREAEEEGWI